jgi:signal transduction histidine kinase/ActR/RegA family two-component response regulator
MSTNQEQKRKALPSTYEELMQANTPVILLSEDLSVNDCNIAAQMFLGWDDEVLSENRLLKDLMKPLAGQASLTQHIQQAITLPSIHVQQLELMKNQYEVEWQIFRQEKIFSGYIVRAENIAIENEAGEFVAIDIYSAVVKKTTGQLVVGRPVLESIKDIIDYYDSIIACMPGNVYWMDRKSTHLGCNANVLKMLGLRSKEQYSGMTYDEMAELGKWKDGEADKFKQDGEEVMLSGQPKLNVEEPPILGPDGSKAVFLSNRVPLWNKKNKLIGLVGISLDITARKEAEEALKKAKQQAEEANQAKSEFLAMMTHELRTPLNVVLGMAQIMLAKDCSKEQREEFLNTILISGNALLGLINDILDFSKAQAGKLEVREEPFELMPLLEQLQTEFSVKGKENNVKYQIETDSNLPQYFLADGQRLRQVFYNLSDNALKFTNNGSVTLTAERFDSLKPNHVGLRVRIKDTGIGIPKEKLETVFEEFSQVNSEKHNEYSRKYGGVGLGLAIVKQLIGLMDAKISVDSEAGKGTTFTCEFDLALPSKKQIDSVQTRDIKVDTSKQKIKPCRVLLVEDNLLNQKVAKHLMNLLNCEVDIANDGSEALAKLQQEYDIVFMDMSLPDMSGLEVTKEYRAKERKNRNQLIIALTANAHADDEKACMEAGMNDFLTKPIMMDKLYDLLAKYVGVQ